MQKEGTVTGLFHCFLVVELVLVFFLMYREGQNREQMVCYHIQDCTCDIYQKSKSLWGIKELPNFKATISSITEAFYVSK